MSLHEFKRNKNAVDSNAILNEIEKNDEAVTQTLGTTGVNIMENVMTSSDQKDVPKEQPKKEVKKTAGKNWKNDDEEEEEPEPPVVVEPEKKKNIDIQVLTSPDEDYLKQVNENSLVPGIHLALGNFQKAINLLKSQIRLANFEQLKPIMRNVYLANKAQFKFIPCLQNNIFHIRDSRSGKMVPSGAVTLTAINAKLNVCWINNYRKLLI